MQISNILPSDGNSLNTWRIGFLFHVGFGRIVFHIHDEMCAVVDSENQDLQPIVFCNITLGLDRSELNGMFTIPSSPLAFYLLRETLFTCCIVNILQNLLPDCTVMLETCLRVVPIQIHPKTHCFPAELQQDISPERLMTVGHQPCLA